MFNQRFLDQVHIGYAALQRRRVIVSVDAHQNGPAVSAVELSPERLIPFRLRPSRIAVRQSDSWLLRKDVFRRDQPQQPMSAANSMFRGCDSLSFMSAACSAEFEGDADIVKTRSR